MRRFGLFATFWLMLLSPLAAAQETSLRELATNEQGKGWEAVGRLNLGKWGFCTASLIAPDVVLTAAHCLYDKITGDPVRSGDLEFLAGWRNGRAEAYRGVRQGVVHPRYVYRDEDRINRVAYDLALLKLDRPIRLPGVLPFETAARPHDGDEVGVVSYAQGRSEAPALQKVCRVLAGRPGILMLSCQVNFGSSGAPVFSFEDGVARIVSVVSSKADMNAQPVALGTSLGQSLDLVYARLDAGESILLANQPPVRRFGQPGQGLVGGGAKFVKP